MSDQRNCQTSGPSVRLFRCIHPRFIFSACTDVAEQKNLQAWRRMEGQEGAISRVNCLAAAVLRHDLNLYDFPSPWRDRPPWLVVWVSDKFRASPRPTAFYAVPRERSTISGSIGSTASVS